MTQLPPPPNSGLMHMVPGGYLPSATSAKYPTTPSAYSYRVPQQHHVLAQSQTTAPTLGQYFRSDNRTVPGRKAPKWAGRTAFWLGMLATVLLLGDLIVNGDPGVLATVATPLSLVAVVFALIAIIAGVGRGLGIFGLVFALAGSTMFWAWLDRTLG